MRSLDPVGLERAHAVCARYRDLEIGLADASMVVLADELATHSVATFDQRHFRTVLALDGRPFTLVPVDESGS